MPTTAEVFLDRLVAEPSVSAAPSAPIVATVLELADPAPDEVMRHDYDAGRKSNLLLMRGPRLDDLDNPAPDRPAGLTLSGHLDVVPADEPDWRGDPWRLTDLGDRWAGRGTSDMKGFVALALDRFRRLDPNSMTAPLALLLTADEEVGSIGAQRWVAERPDTPLPRQVVIGEPTQLTAVRMHKGHLRLRLELAGHAAHSGYPHRGANAIEPAGPALVALAALRRELEAQSHPAAEHFPEVPFVTLNVGRIAGGVATNVVPDRCTLDIGLRPLPGDTSEALIERLEAVLSGALEGVDWSLAIDNDSPPLRTRPEAPLFGALRDLLGQTADPGVGFSSDGGTLARRGLDCVLFGPGSIEVAHKANESLPKDQFERAGAVLDDLIERFCGARPA